MNAIRFRCVVYAIVFIATFTTLTLLKVSRIHASVKIWGLDNTTDCSGLGGNGSDFSNLCYNQNGVNSTISWIHGDDPAIHIKVIVGHQYRFTETSNFNGPDGNFISNFLTDGNGYDYGKGKDWICSNSSCSQGNWIKEFEAISEDLYFLQSSACSLTSYECFTSNIELTDLSMPNLPADTPITVWELQSTSNCSNNGTSSSLCFNQNGINSTISWIHNNDPAISIDIIPNHTYTFYEQTTFTGNGEDFISNFLTDGNGYDYGLGNDWICSSPNCSHGEWSKTFTANSAKLYFAQASSCTNSENCFTKNLKLIDLNGTEKLPVTKIFFAPGLGASWNLNDFITCGKSSKQDGWTLAPYANGVYTEVLETLSNAGWEIKPFYYDWRQYVSDNSTLLASYINNNVSTDEKVNFVGHSMGGLIGRGYMETNSGGKLAKYYSVGTPHQGSALAYAPWEGGEVWTGNLIEKIGIDLYLKHCGGINSNNRTTIQSSFPSIQNLLPTLPYLRNKSDGNLKDISSMKIKNNFITSNFVAPFWGVKVGTLSGDGQKTLNIIDVVGPSRFDLRLGNWIDGSPVGKEYSNEGDGVVLKSSSQLSDAFQNDVITQTHRGLVGSTDGINAILSFLGSPGIEDPPYSDDTSALVLVGYPGNFQITDENGKITNSENGMIAIMNPNNSNYQLQFDTNVNKTTLIIDQFLSNGQKSYKEYKYQKAPEDVKIIEFNSKKVNPNPIHEVKEYKKPHFPVYWHGFWKWWSKYRR